MTWDQEALIAVAGSTPVTQIKIRQLDDQLCIIKDGLPVMNEETQKPKYQVVGNSKPYIYFRDEEERQKFRQSMLGLKPKCPTCGGYLDPEHPDACPDVLKKE